MSEHSSTGEAGVEEAGGLRGTSVPAPPRPPAPLHDDAMHDDAMHGNLGSPLDDGGPATSAMSATPADGAEPFDRGVRGAPRGDYTGFTSSLPPLVPVTAPGATRVVRDRRPQVAVRGPRRAKLVIRRVDPWSVMKFTFLFSVCLLVVWVVAASALLSLLRTMHVFENINSVLASATSSDATTKGFQINPNAHDVRLWAAILGAVNALLFTALATLAAFLYNLISMLVGGVEVTMAERD